MTYKISLSLNGGCKVVTETFKDDNHFDKWWDEQIKNGFKIIGYENA